MSHVKITHFFTCEDMFSRESSVFHWCFYNNYFYFLSELNTTQHFWYLIFFIAIEGWWWSPLLCVLFTEHATILGFPTVAFQCAVRQREFPMFGSLPITCLSSANQQFVQLIFAVNYPNSTFSISPFLFETLNFIDHMTLRNCRLWNEMSKVSEVFPFRPGTLPKLPKIEFQSYSLLILLLVRQLQSLVLR